MSRDTARQREHEAEIQQAITTRAFARSKEAVTQGSALKKAAVQEGK